MAHGYRLKAASLSLLPLTLFSLAVLGTTGCGMGNQGSSASSPSTSTTQTIQGSVYGGQQPVVGATIQLYAAGTTGLGQGATPLISAPLPTTNANGSFTFTYTLPSTPSHFYIVATGGRPGSGNPENPDIVMMAALGSCTASTTIPSTYININEVTTAAAVLELQPFIAAPTGIAGASVVIGAPAANYNDLRTAFENVSSLASVSTGAVVNSTGSKGKLINTLADILASCVNSDPTSATPNNCSNLFSYATPSSDTAAADTVQAAWYIAQNPTRNVSALFGLVPPNPPFVALSSAPTAGFAVSTSTGLLACFAVLGNSAITSTGSTVVSGGDLGIYPATGAAVTGFTFSSPTGPGIVTGAPTTVHLTDAVAENAQGDLTLAYDYAKGLTGALDLTGQDLGSFNSSTPLTPGVYKFTSTAQLTGTLALDAQNDADAVFVFQIGSTLTTASSSQVVLLNGAQARNVFWQVGSSATLGTSSTLEGAVMAYASITVESGATLQGQALASTGAVTLTGNTVTAP
ncbi:MAG: ice-binding family protein [Terracidiphilus sp.]|nr:ice-binding family protein [Terracidiphilus sp.]